MRTDVFQTSRGDRPTVRNVAVVISDGNSNVYQNNTIPEAVLAKSNGVTILSVVVTNAYNLQEMTSIATNSTYVYLLPNSTYIASIVSAVVNQLCSL